MGKIQDYITAKKANETRVSRYIEERNSAGKLRQPGEGESFADYIQRRKREEDEINAKRAEMGVEKTREVDKPETETMAASYSRGETQRGSRVGDTAVQVIPGKTVAEENKTVNATVRSAEDIAQNLRAVDSQIKKLDINTTKNTSWTPENVQSEEQKQKLDSLKTTRERLQQEYNAATRLPDADEVAVPQNYTRNMPVTIPEGVRRTEYWASIPDYTDLTANLAELETKKQELTDSLNRSTRDLRVEKQKLLSQKGNSAEKQSRLAEIDAKLKEAEEKAGISAINQQIAELESTLPASYAKLQRSADFEQNGVFDEGFAKLSKDDMYNLVNKPNEENDLLRNTYTQGNVKAGEGVKAFSDIVTDTVFNDPAFIRNMTDDERKTYNYIYKQSGKEAADKYLATIESGLTARYREQIEEQSKKYAKEHPVAASALTVAAAPLKAVGFAGQAADYVSDGKIDQNSPRNAAAYSSAAVRGEVSENVDEFLSKNLGEAWGNVGSNAYQIGMSMGDFVFSTFATGGAAPFASFVMGSSAAADTTIRAKDRGLKDSQAFALGIISGSVELLTEKYSIDTLLEKSGMGKKAFTYWLKNVIGEGSEEVSSEFLNIVADIMVAGDKSEWNQSMEKYKQNGLSEKDAFWNTFADNAINLGVSFIGGAVSGGVLAGGKLIGDGVDRKITHSSGQVHRKIYDADTANKTKNLSAVNDALENAKTVNVSDTSKLTEASAEFVRTIQNAQPETKNAVNTAIDYVREEIAQYNDLIKNTKDVNQKREYITERAVAINVDKTLRSNRAEINEILAKTPVQTAAQTEPQADTTAGQPKTASVAETAAESEVSVGVDASVQPVSETETQTEQTVEAPQNTAETVSAASAEDSTEVPNGSDSVNRKIADDLGFDGDFQTPEEAVERLDVSSDNFRNIHNQINAYRAENTAESNVAADRLTEIDRIMIEKNRPKVQKTANAYAPYLKQFGINGVVVEDMAVGQNASFDRKTNTIHLSSRISDSGAVGRFIVHEFAHRGAQIDMSLADSIVAAMDKVGGGRAYVSEETIHQHYADQLAGKSAEEADSIVREERAAHFMERIMEDVDVLDEFRDDRTFLRKILDAIRDFFARNNPDKQEQIRLQKIEKKINDLLKAANVDAEVKADRGTMQSGNAGMRFSLDTPVEEAGELIAVHNLSEEKLKKVFELGGFPMPSVAIVRAQDGHEGFGDISVVFGKEVIDPKKSKSNKVYSADAWTPTYPTVEYKANEEVEGRVTAKYYDLKKRFGDEAARPLRRYTGDLSDELTRHGGVEGIVDNLRDNTDMMQLYLLDNGGDIIEPVMVETETVMSDDEQAMYRGFIEALGQDVVLDAFVPEGVSPSEHRRQYIAKNIDAIKKAYKEMLMGEFSYTSEEADTEMSGKNSMQYASFVKQAARFLRNGPKNVKTETDYAATKQAILDAVDADGYADWLEALFEGAVEKTGIRNKQDTFTPSGKRRSWEALHYENTLENVVKAMKDSGEKGLGVLGGGNIFGASTTEYKSVPDIKKDASKRLRKVSQEEYADMKQEFQDRLFDLAARLSRRDDSRARDDAMDILVEAVSKNKTPAGIDSYIKRESEGYANYSPEISADLIALVEDIRAMPAAYFEAKPQRAVGVDEISAFVVPNDIKDSTRKLLDSTNAQVVEYERGDTESRLNALNSLSDLRFSRELDGGNHYDYSKSFAEQIDDYKAGNLPKYDTLVVGGTPEVFQKIGLNPLPMTYGTGHLEDVIKGNKPDHDFGVENLKKIPEALKSPVAIFTSNTHPNSSVVAILDLSYNNKPMFAAVEIDGLGQLNGKRIDSNAITTVHTRGNAANLLKNAISEHNKGKVALFYVDKKETTRFLNASGVQFPGGISLSDGYIHSIHDPGSPVNTKFQSVTQTKQFKEWFGDWEKHPKNASKVVNEDGTPKIVYHGTPNGGFTVFDKEKIGSSTLDIVSDLGFYFTNDPYVAHGYRDRSSSGETKAVYLDIKNPLIVEDTGWGDAVSQTDNRHKDLARWAKEGGHDGIIVRSMDEEIEVDGRDEVDTVYIVFESNQIKSATDNIGTFDENNSDIRYSRDLETPEQRHTRLVEENNEYLKKQFRSQTAFGWAKTVSPAQRNKFAGTIAADIPGVSTDEVSAEIKPVFDLLEKPKRGAKDTAEVRFEEARKMAQTAAEKLVDSAIQTEINSLYEQYNDLRNFLRTTPVKLNISKEEFGGTEAYSKWRNGNKGLLRVSDDSSARTIDQVYKEISAQYPEFFPEDLTDLSEMLRRMSDVAVMLKAEAGNKTVKVNPLEDVRDSFVQDVTNRILFGFDELARITPAAKYEYSAKVNERDVQQAYAEGSRDAAAREAQAYESGVKEGRRQNEREVQVARQREDIQYQIFQRDFNEAVNNFNREIERQNKRIDALQTRVEKRGQQEQLAVAKKVVYGRLNRLNTMLTKPNRSKHIPQNLRAPVARLLETVGTTRLANGKTVNAETMRNIQEQEYARFEAESVRVADDLATAINLNRVSEDNAVSQQYLEKLTENIVRLKEMYSEMNPNSPDDAVLPPDLVTTRQIDYVKQLNKILAMVENYIKDSNTVFLAGKATSAKDFSERLISDLRGKTAPNESNRLRKFVHDVGYEFVSADLFFRMVGESGEDIMRQYRKAQTIQSKCEEEYAQYLLGKTGGKYSTNDAGFNGKLIDITVDGKTIKATRAQIMQLYMTWKRPAGRRHLRTGGAIFVNEAGVELAKNTVLINDKTYNELVSHLTDEDKRIADALGNFMVHRCAEWGNDASMQMYGYRMFEDPHYFPMDVSNNVLPANWDSMDEFYRLENAGMTKSLKENASAPLRMTDIFDITDFHVRTMAAYTAYAPVSNDVQRIMNMPGVSEAVNVGMGKKGAKYLETLVKTIASNKVRSGDMSDAARPLQFFMNAYKRQAVSYNISTALKQPLSIVRALNEIDAKYIVKVPPTMSGREYSRAYNAMIENSGVAKMKMLGYSDTGFGKSLRQIYDTGYVNESGIIRGSIAKTKAGRTAVKTYDKITDAGMWAAGKMDEATWVRLWRACELEVADKHKGLSAKEKTAKVAERFNEIIGRTQVVDTVLDTSPLMRNNAMAILTPFMNEPTKALASIITAADAARDGKPNGKKKLAKAVGLVALNNLLLEPIVSSLMTMWRDEEDDTENIADFSKKFLKLYAGIDLDGETSVSSVMTSNAVSGIFGFPIIQIFYNTFSDSMQNYGNEKIDTAALSNLVKDTKNLIVNIQKAPVDRVETNYKLFSDFLGSAAAAIGIPLPTLRRQVSAMGRAILEYTDNYEAQWDYARFLYNLENGAARSQKQFYDIMAAAYKAGDTEAYQYMLNDLKNTQTGKKTIGVSWNKMKKYIEDRGGKYEVGSDLWNVSLQAEFNLSSLDRTMKAERTITEVYNRCIEAGMDEDAATKVIYKAPENGNFILDGEEIEMSLAESTEYIHNVGELAHGILRCFKDDYRWANMMSLLEQSFALQKASEFAKMYYKKKHNSAYKLDSWMERLYERKINCKEIASAVIKYAMDKK